jgi:hypothetical protein
MLMELIEALSSVNGKDIENFAQMWQEKQDNLGHLDRQVLDKPGEEKKKQNEWDMQMRLLLGVAGFAGVTYGSIFMRRRVPRMYRKIKAAKLDEKLVTTVSTDKDLTQAYNLFNWISYGGASALTKESLGQPASVGNKLDAIKRNINLERVKDFQEHPEQFKTPKLSLKEQLKMQLMAGYLTSHFPVSFYKRKGIGFINKAWSSLALSTQEIDLIDKHRSRVLDNPYAAYNF